MCIRDRLFDYLVETRGWKNGVAKSVATTNLINALADYHKVPLYETPVGFKYIGELIIADKIAIGGEESAGLTIRGHVPEKDGVLAGLLVAEMVAVRGKSLGVQLKELFGKVGSFYPVRENFRLTDVYKRQLPCCARHCMQQTLHCIGSMGPDQATLSLIHISSR